MDLHSMLSHYALQRARPVRKFESYGNDNWLVEDQSGARFVLRRQWLNARANRLEFQIALQSHLASHGVPTAPLVRAGDGSDRVVDDESVPWLLTGHIEGEEYDFGRSAQTAAAGGLLARFHRAAEGFGTAAPGPEHKQSIGACWAGAEQDIEELVRLIARDAADELVYLQGRWAELLREWPASRLDALPAGWLHGDFHGRNLVYNGDDVVGLLDFDDVDRGPYAYDIAAGVVKFGREGRGSLRLRPSFARHFLDGYESVRALTAEERLAVPVLAPMGYPPNARHYSWWRDRHSRDLTALLRDDVASMKKLHVEVARIAPSLFAAD